MDLPEYSKHDRSPPPKYSDEISLPTPPPPVTSDEINSHISFEYILDCHMITKLDFLWKDLMH